MTPFEQLHEDFALHMQSDAKNFQEIKDMLTVMDGKLGPLNDAYAGVLFGKKLLTGTAAVIVALATIGGAILWFAGYLTTPK